MKTYNLRRQSRAKKGKSGKTARLSPGSPRKRKQAVGVRTRCQAQLEEKGRFGEVGALGCRERRVSEGR
jgi:hypothetical protein